jgi:hypothetical protein
MSERGIGKKGRENGKWKKCPQCNARTGAGDIKKKASLKL